MYLLENQLSHKRVRSADRKNSCHCFIRNFYNTIELNVLITKVTFSKKIDWIIVNIRSTFYKALKLVFILKFHQIRILSKSKISSIVAELCSLSEPIITSQVFASSLIDNTQKLIQLVSIVID